MVALSADICAEEGSPERSGGPRKKELRNVHLRESKIWIFALLLTPWLFSQNDETRVHTPATVSTGNCEFG